VLTLPANAAHRRTQQVMIARGWTEVPIEGGGWEFAYADVGWIHEHITYQARARSAERGASGASVRCACFSR
jgi:hypothetical protein